MLLQVFFAVAAKKSLITILKKIYMFFVACDEIMNNSIIGNKGKKILLWTLFDIDDEEEEEEVKEVEEFRVCDCFIDWLLFYRHKFKDDLYDEWTMVDFFIEIPSDNITSDVYAMFGPVTILCCQKGLYHFLYMSKIDHDYFFKKM